ncbi:unnamed protein product [Vitrella brassicaformis CCMP3155]|uniref:Protein-tyrosine-phosphatase n=2 Tax=Vitrella brassicaformis TaxID=1169539 RepID=A0A0G4GLF8_VITBC|nr:unnamed protein product [Vitrella brassicaformis CCMP3155]|eukprot:CEM30965.1 unnamed protein product [Vitrella brassicaformis CCMP3155]
MAEDGISSPAQRDAVVVRYSSRDSRLGMPSSNDGRPPSFGHSSTLSLDQVLTIPEESQAGPPPGAACSSSRTGANAAAAAGGWAARRIKKPMRSLTIDVSETVTDAAEAPDSSRADVRRKREETKYDCARVRDRLYISSEEVAKDKSMLLSHGISHVVNAAVECPNVFENDPNMRIQYHTLDLRDKGTQVLDESVLESTVAWIQGALDNGGSVLVHCKAGISRSATLVIAYLMRVEGMSYDEAVEEVRKVRHAVDPNLGFVEQVTSWANRERENAPAAIPGRASAPVVPSHTPRAAPAGRLFRK